MATSCLKDAITSILTQMGTIPFDWSTVQGSEKSKPTKLFQLVRIWNDQVRREADGKQMDGVSGYVFEKPACFLEMVPEASMHFTDNVTFTDICWKMHIVDYELDAGDDENMDQNLNVFGHRDLLVQYMAAFAPTNCSTMFKTDERQDYEHTGVYHYIVDMKSGLTDTKASVLDPDQVRVIYKQPPTNLELNTGFTSGDTPPVDPHTSYISQVYPVGKLTIVDIPDPLNTITLGNGAVIPAEYALNGDGTLTIPYLNSIEGISVLVPFMVGNAPADTVVWVYNAVEETYVFDNSTGGGFVIGNTIEFNASLPNL